MPALSRRLQSRPWHWDASRVLATLMLRNARAAQNGRACPIAARVLARLESQIGGAP
jgi:hypothetical protein